MLNIARASSSRLAAVAVPAARGISTTSICLASGGKAKKPTKQPARTKAPSSFAKRAKQAPAGAAGGGGGGGSNITLRYSDARQPADTSDWLQLHPQSITNESVGRPAVIPRVTLQQIQTFGFPRGLDKQLSDHNSPSCVIRSATVDLADRLDAVASGSKPTEQILLTGERGAGKSMLLLQAVSHALDNGWIVLYAPRASEWTNSSSAYTYDPSSQTFHQPALSVSILTHLLSVNTDRLSRLKTRKSLTIGGQELNSGTDFVTLIKKGTGTDAAAVSVQVLEAVMDELASQTQIPVLVAIDEVQALFARSSYLTPRSEPVQSYHLSVPLLFLRYLTATNSTSQPAPSGQFQKGAVISTYSYTTPHLAPTLSFLHALGLPTPSAVTPYTRLSQTHARHAALMAGNKYEVGELGNKAAAGMFEIFARKGWGAKGDESYLAALISSGGNALEFSRSLNRSMVSLA